MAILISCTFIYLFIFGINKQNESQKHLYQEFTLSCHCFFIISLIYINPFIIVSYPPFLIQVKFQINEVLIKIWYENSDVGKKILFNDISIIFVCYILVEKKKYRQQK